MYRRNSSPVRQRASNLYTKSRVSYGSALIALQASLFTPATIVLLVLSQYIEGRAAAALLDGRPAGIGYLLKERVSAIDDFVQVCRDVAAGGSVIDPLVTEQLLTSRRHDDALNRLTEREREVLSLMAQGSSNPSIGASLHLGMKTVESHVRSIFQKLDLDQTTDGNRRVQAVLRWLQRSSQ